MAPSLGAALWRGSRIGMDGGSAPFILECMRDDRVCVIGAGAAGLGAMEVLQRHGIAFDCFEQSERVGGHWHTDYESLHLITSRDLSGFAGHPMPSHYPGLSEPRPDARLPRVASRPRPACAPTCASASGSSGSCRSAWPGATAGAWRPPTARRARTRGVLVCNGHLWDPHLPDVPGRVHRPRRSTRARTARPLTSPGTRVLTVGAGNSGCDLAVDVANARLESTISIRRGQMFQPKAVFGRPRAEIGWLAKLPVRRQRADRAGVVGRRHRPGARVPRPARAGDPQPQRPAAGGQQPAAVLDPARPDRRRAGDRALRRRCRCTSRTGRAASSTRSSGRPASRPRSRSSTRSLIRWRDGVPLRTAGLTLPVGAENLYLVGLAAPRGPQLPVYSAPGGAGGDDAAARPGPPLRARRALRRDRRPRRAHRHRPRDLGRGRCATPSGRSSAPAPPVAAR